MLISFPGFRPGGNRNSTDRVDAPAHPSPALAEVRAYWEALRHSPDSRRRGGTGLPLRRAIDPRGIEGALDAAFMLERVAPGMARIRLAGTQLVDMMGMEVRGMPVSALFEPMARNRLAPALEEVFRSPAALTLRLEAERGIGRPALSARMLILPLEDDRGQSDLALGVLDLDGQIGRSPRRFAIAGLTREGIVATAPAARPAAPVSPPVAAGFAEPAMDFRPRILRPHLRLVKSDVP